MNVEKILSNKLESMNKCRSKSMTVFVFITAIVVCFGLALISEKFLTHINSTSAQHNAVNQ